MIKELILRNINATIAVSVDLKDVKEHFADRIEQLKQNSKYSLDEKIQNLKGSILEKLYFTALNPDGVDAVKIKVGDDIPYYLTIESIDEKTLANNMIDRLDLYSLFTDDLMEQETHAKHKKLCLVL